MLIFLSFEHGIDQDRNSVALTPDTETGKNVGAPECAVGGSIGVRTPPGCSCNACKPLPTTA